MKKWSIREKKSDKKKEEQGEKTDQRVKGGKLKTLNDKGQVREMHLGKDEQM